MRRGPVPLSQPAPPTRRLIIARGCARSRNGDSDATLFSGRISSRSRRPSTRLYELAQTRMREHEGEAKRPRARGEGGASSRRSPRAGVHRREVKAVAPHPRPRFRDHWHRFTRSGSRPPNDDQRSWMSAARWLARGMGGVGGGRSASASHTDELPARDVSLACGGPEQRDAHFLCNRRLRAAPNRQSTAFSSPCYQICSFCARCDSPHKKPRRRRLPPVPREGGRSWVRSRLVVHDDGRSHSSSRDPSLRMGERAKLLSEVFRLCSCCRSICSVAAGTDPSIDASRPPRVSPSLLPPLGSRGPIALAVRRRGRTVWPLPGCLPGRSELPFRSAREGATGRQICGRALRSNKA